MNAQAITLVYNHRIKIALFFFNTVEEIQYLFHC